MKRKKNIKSTTKPQKNLIRILKNRSGRDSTGKISVRHRGGRQKRFYRKIDFARDKRNIEGKVVGIEYDPNRTSNIALIEYSDGEKRYILAPAKLKIGDKIIASDDAPIKLGNALPLNKIPLGTQVHNIELIPGKGGQLAKSAGGWAVLIAKDKKYADVKLPSREVRKIPLASYGTIGQVSRTEHKLEKIGSAGRKRLMGFRPTVRGVAQHPGSHPHGGGEGRSGTGGHPKTPWGKIAMGGRTRKRKKWSDKLIISRKK